MRGPSMNRRKIDVSEFDWKEALRDFLYWKKAQGVSARTIGDYDERVSTFFRRYPDAKDNLGQRILEHMAEPVAPSTYNLRLEYIRAFFNWCVEQRLLSESPMKALRRRRVDDRIVDVGPELLKRLLELPDRSTYAGLRDYALILLTLDTGIRPGEAFGLRKPDFNLRSLEVCVRSDVAKTRVSRTLPISPITASAVAELIRVRPDGWPIDGPVFCTVEGQALRRFAWGKRVAQYGHRMGVHLRPYDLRHCFALEFLRNGGNAFALQRTMGHTDISMTKRYVALTQEDLRQQHMSASPLQNLVPTRTRLRKLR